MLQRLSVSGFKSLTNVDVRLPQLTVLFGPNAAGKSNFLDALQALSRIGTSRTVSEGLGEPIRGYPIEAFSFAAGGLPALLGRDRAEFKLSADLLVGQDLFRYRVAVEINPTAGTLAVSDEYLTALSKLGDAKGTPSIEKIGTEHRVRRSGKQGRPRNEPGKRNYTSLSDPRLSGSGYRPIEIVRQELTDWKFYYLDPRSAMRVPKPPSDVSDIGVLGEELAPFLFRLKAEEPKRFDAVRRTLTSLIPSIESLAVDLDTRRGTLDIVISQHGQEYSSRIVSEGTLRVLALSAIAANPWSRSLLAFEEPENGVHPRRIELIAQLITSLAVHQRRQVIVTTHSPLFCNAVLKQAREYGSQIALLSVRRGRDGTRITPFEADGPLFSDGEIARALTTQSEDGLFEQLLLRGLENE